MEHFRVLHLFRFKVEERDLQLLTVMVQKIRTDLPVFFGSSEVENSDLPFLGKGILDKRTDVLKSLGAEIALPRTVSSPARLEFFGGVRKPRWCS